MNVYITVSHFGQKRWLNVNVRLYMYGYPVINVDRQIICLIICQEHSESICHCLHIDICQCLGAPSQMALCNKSGSTQHFNILKLLYSTCTYQKRKVEGAITHLHTHNLSVHVNYFVSRTQI